MAVSCSTEIGFFQIRIKAPGKKIVRLYYPSPMNRSKMPPCVPQIRLYQNWLRETRGLTFDSYDALWRWSTSDLNAFWQSVWDYFDLQSPTPHNAVCDGAPMPDTRWFVGAKVNYAQQVLRHVEA